MSGTIQEGNGAVTTGENEPCRRATTDTCRYKCGKIT